MNRLRSWCTDLTVHSIYCNMQDKRLSPMRCRHPNSTRNSAPVSSDITGTSSRKGSEFQSSLAAFLLGLYLILCDMDVSIVYVVTIRARSIEILMISWTSVQTRKIEIFTISWTSVRTRRRTNVTFPLLSSTPSDLPLTAACFDYMASEPS